MSKSTIRIYSAQLLKSNRGFSLVELGVVLIIGALMMVPIYSLLYYVSDIKPTDERMEIVQEALAEHHRVTGLLPCPAPLGADMAVNGAYQADCTIPSVGGVLVGALPIEPLQAAVGCGGAFSVGAQGVAGTVKTALLGIAEEFGWESTIADLAGGGVTTARAENVRCPLRDYLLDAQGHKFIYAVSQNATVAGFDMFLDPWAVQVVNANGAVQSVLYTVVGLGPDAQGATNGQGVLSGVLCAGAENCDNDAVFTALPYSAVFDDRVEFGLARFMQEDSFWQWAVDGAGVQNTVLHDDAMLVINAGGDLPVGGIDPADSVVVANGNLNIAGTMQVEAWAGAVAGPIVDVMSVETEVANVRDIVTATEYCYPQGEALTQFCEDGGTPAGGNAAVVRACRPAPGQDPLTAGVLQDERSCCTIVPGVLGCCPLRMYEADPNQCRPVFWP